jgi:hypothetical protein
MFPATTASFRRAALAGLLVALGATLAASTARADQPRWWLGVNTCPTHWGYRVNSVFPDSPAWEADLYAGDYIQAVDGCGVGVLPQGQFYSLRRALNHSAGGHVELRVLYFNGRDKEWITFHAHAQLDPRTGAMEALTTHDDDDGKPARERGAERGEMLSAPAPIVAPRGSRREHDERSDVRRAARESRRDDRGRRDLRGSAPDRRSLERATQR